MIRPLPLIFTLFTLLVLVPRVVAAQAPPPSEDPPAPAPAPVRDVAAEERAQDDRPSVAVCVREALRLAQSDPARSRRAQRRARRAAFLPELRLRARRGRERDQNLSSGGTNLSTDNDTVLEATLVFDLSRAVYGPDEVAWSRERRAQQSARLQLVRLVVRLYFERRRLRIESLLGEGDFESDLRIAEIEAILDHLTGGRFTETEPPEG